MSISLNLVCTSASSFINEKIVAGLTPLQKKIAIIAAALFACCCLIYRFRTSIFAIRIEKKQPSFFPQRSFELSERNEWLRKQIKSHWKALKSGQYKRKLSAKEDMSLIIDQIYHGNSVACQEWLNRDHILQVPSIVISVASEEEMDLKNGQDNIEHFILSVSDDRAGWEGECGIKRNLKNVFQLFDKARINEMPLLVHCVSGISRSTTILAAYLMWSCSLRYEPVIAFMKTKRSQIGPTPALKDILAGDYQDMLTGEGLLKVKQHISP